MNTSVAPKAPQPASTKALLRDPGARAARARRVPATAAPLPPRMGPAARSHLPRVRPRRPQDRHAPRGDRDGAEVRRRRRRKPSSAPRGDRTLTGYATSAFARHYASRSAASPSSPSSGSSPKTRPSPSPSSSAVSTHGESASSRGCSVGGPAIRPSRSRVRPYKAVRGASAPRACRRILAPPTGPTGDTPHRPSSLTGLEAARLGGHQLPELRDSETRRAQALEGSWTMRRPEMNEGSIRTIVVRRVPPASGSNPASSTWNVTAMS